MTPDLWIITVLGALAVVWKSLKIIRWFKQQGKETTENATSAAESTPDPDRFFFAFIAVCGIAFGVGLLLAVTVLQKESPSPGITLFVCLIGLVVVSGLLRMFVGLSFNKRLTDVDNRLKVVEQHCLQKGTPKRQISINRKPFKKIDSAKKRASARRTRPRNT